MGWISEPATRKALGTLPAGEVPWLLKLVLIFGTSALVLTLQLLQSRILAVQFWHHLVYFVITMGFIGFAASGTYLSVSERVHARSERAFFALCLGGLALGMFVSRVVLAALPNTRFGFLDLWSILPITVAYTALMIPYFFAGLLVGGALRREPRVSGWLYFASLAGSAAGCLVFVALITPLGAPGLLQALFVLAAVPALVLWQPGGKGVAASLAGIALGAAFIALLPIQPDRGKQYWWFPNEPVEFSEWNPISRIDVISTARIPWMKFILIDGDAQAPMFLGVPPGPDAPVIPLDTPHRQALYALADASAPGRVLVIGVGGGADVLTAKRYGARRVDAVEINPTTARIIKNEYAGFNGHLLSSNGVALYNEDGRSFAARTSNRYDAIVLYAVDSLAASTTGAYVLMENYLYTLEAFGRYWQLLSDHGLLQISRWHNPNAPNESLRVFTQAYEALAAQGVTDPGRHIAVLGDGPNVQAPFADVIVSRRSLTRDDADTLARFAQKSRLAVLYLHPAVAPPGLVPPTAFRRFAEAYAEGQSGQFYASYRFNVTPVMDDDPFFFSYRRWSDILPRRGTPSVKYYDDIIGTKPLILLIVLIGQSTALVLLLVVWPIVRSRRREPVSGADGLILVFFALIGLGFMLIEIPLIQRFVLLLGHPTYSMGVTLPGILLGAALGSYLSGSTRIAAAARIGIATAGIVLGILALHLGQESLVRGVLAWPLAGRLAIVAVVAGAFGLLMGIPFPTAVEALARQPHLVSLGWAVNGGSTVVASVLAIPVAMNWGFGTVLAVAGACYLSAWLVFGLWYVKAPGFNHEPALAPARTEVGSGT